MTSAPVQEAAARKGLVGFLLRPTRVPATLQVLSAALLIYVFATSRITLMDALVMAAVLVVAGVVAFRLVFGMRQRYGQQDQQEESRDLAQARRLPLGLRIWKTLGSQRMPLAWLAVMYVCLTYAMVSIKFPSLP